MKYVLIKDWNPFVDGVKQILGFIDQWPFHFQGCQKIAAQLVPIYEWEEKFYNNLPYLEDTVKKNYAIKKLEI